MACERCERKDDCDFIPIRQFMEAIRSELTEKGFDLSVEKKRRNDDHITFFFTMSRNDEEYLFELTRLVGTKNIDIVD